MTNHKISGKKRNNVNQKKKKKDTKQRKNKKVKQPPINPLKLVERIAENYFVKHFVFRK